MAERTAKRFPGLWPFRSWRAAWLRMAGGPGVSPVEAQSVAERTAKWFPGLWPFRSWRAAWLRMARRAWRKPVEAQSMARANREAVSTPQPGVAQRTPGKCHHPREPTLKALHIWPRNTVSVHGGRARDEPGKYAAAAMTAECPAIGGGTGSMPPMLKRDGNAPAA